MAEPDADPVAVLRGDIDQQSFDVARVGSRPHHVQKPVAAVLVTPEFDANCPIGVIELGFFSGGEIPIDDDIEVGRDRVNDGTPFPLKYSPAAGRIFQLPPSSRRSSVGMTAAVNPVAG